jgi:hypothetical protein
LGANEVVDSPRYEENGVSDIIVSEDENDFGYHRSSDAMMKSFALGLDITYLTE